MNVRKVMNRACPVCGCTAGDVLLEIAFEPEPFDLLPNNFDVCFCEQCGFCMSDLRASQELFDSYYATLNKYQCLHTGGSGGTDPVDEHRWKYVIEVLDPYLHKGMRILDIGSGRGGLLQALKRKGFENIFSIEPSGECRRLMQLDGIVCYASFEECVQSRKLFDCIIVCQVMEHIYDLPRFMSKMQSVSVKDAVVYVDVPDAERYKDNLLAPYYYFDREHINHFTKTSLAGLFVGFGFVSRYLVSSDMAMVEKTPSSIVSGIFRSDDRVPNFVPLDRDVTRGAIEEYIKLSEQLDVFPGVDSLRQITESVFLWGLGYYLRRLLRKGIFSGIKIEGIIDRDKGGRGLFFNNLPIYDAAVLDDPRYSHAAVLVTSSLYSLQIIEALKMRGHQGVVVDVTQRTAVRSCD